MSHTFSLSEATISILGDSITAFNVYQPQLQELVKAKAINTYGVPGSTMSGAAENSFLARVQQIEPASDLVFVFGGVNDFYFSVPLGQVSDSPSCDTFYAGVRLLIWLIRERCPQAALVFATPLQCTVEAENGHDGKNLHGHSLKQYAQAILEVCQSEHVPVIDLHGCSKLTAANASEYLSDGVHPNEQGMAVLAQDIARGLDELLPRQLF